MRPLWIAVEAIVLCLLVSVWPSDAPAGDSPLVESINPIIGASASSQYGEGKTFPGAAMPFGLVQLSPDTITGGDNGSGYSWEHKTIEGFSFTHLSGVGWYGDLGNFQVMPTTGPLKTERGRSGAEDGFRSRFHHETETASAGYYAVTLDDYGIRAEMTAAPRTGILRFTFPQSDQSRIQIDLARRIGGTSTRQYVKVVDDHTIEGWMKCPPAGGGWGDGAGHADYTVYFSAQFSRPLGKFGVWSADIPAGWSRKREDIESERYRKVVAGARILDGCREMEGDHLGFFSEFPTQAGEQVLLKCGISFVSIAGARENLNHDIPDWDFESVHQQAVALWRDALQCASIEGGTPAQRETFATAMYHAMLDPRAYSDVDGLYTGADGKVHPTGDFTYRTIFSGWDVFRSEFPLFTLIRPDVVNDMVNSLTEQADLSGNGYLARWEIMTAESGCMSGDPAVSIFAEAYLDGIRNYDVSKAYELCASSVSSTGNRNGRKDYESLGYVPDSITGTMENAYYDYCAGRFAEALGKTNAARLFYQRSLNYRNIYDPGVGNMHARKRDGSWTTWKGATAEGQGCEESNPYQQNWFAPQDVAGLIGLMGPDYFVSYLTDFFEKTPASFKWNEYCNQSNEPVHHTPYLFVYAGKPWLTQKWARFIMDHAYGPGLAGLCGNEDVGQMSAWYVLSAIGLHPVSPVDGIYVIGSPLFPRATLQLDPKYHHGKTFSVIAHDNSAQNIYIQSAKLNGQPLERAWLRYDEITAGGELELEMGDQPNKDWGSAPAQIPPSFCTSMAISPLPANAPAAAPADSPISGADVNGGPHRVQLGREQYGNGRWYLDGLIDEARIYNRALSGAEIATLSSTNNVSGGLIRYWNFDNLAGSTVPDLSGLGAGGTVVGGVVLSNGVSGLALSLDGSGNYVDTPACPVQSQLTASAFINLRTLPVSGNAQYIFSTGEWSDGWSLGISGGYLRMAIGSTFAQGGSFLPTNQWVHVAGTYDGNTIRTYVDGRQVASVVAGP